MKLITFKFYNKITGEGLGDMTFPYTIDKSISGHYSKSWKNLKKGVAGLFKIEPRLVRAKILFLKNV